MPLFGDMQLAPISFLKMSPCFDPSKWLAGSEVNEASLKENQYNIIKLQETFMGEYSAFIADASLMQSKVKDVFSGGFP